MAHLNHKVFIVDDEALLSEMLTDYLLNYHPNLEITSFMTGEECLKHIYEQPAIVILDYHLNSKNSDYSKFFQIKKK